MGTNRGRGATTAEAEIAKDVDGFGEESDVIESGKDAQALSVRLAEGMDEGAAVVVYEPGKDAPAQVKPEALIGQPFVATGVRVFPVVKDYETGEVAYHLAVVAAQAVKVDANNNITRKGRVVVFIAGRVDPEDDDRSSVLGREFNEVLIGRNPTPDSPVLFPTGIRMVPTAAGGRYYTIRPESSKVVDLFPDD